MKDANLCCTTVIQQHQSLQNWKPPFLLRSRDNSNVNKKTKDGEQHLQKYTGNQGNNGSGTNNGGNSRGSHSAMRCLKGINTSAKSKQRFSTRHQERAKMISRFQLVAGHPSDTTSIHALMSNSRKNSPITKQDVVMTLNMLGRSKYALQAKRTCPTPAAIIAEEQMISIPDLLMNYYENVKILANIMHVNRIPFLVSMSKHIHCGSSNALKR